MVRGNINNIGRQATQVAFKNCVPFTKCITKIDGTTINDAEDLDLALPMYNLIEYNSNYSEATGSLWFYSKDEATNFNADIANTNLLSIRQTQLNFLLYGQLGELFQIGRSAE